MSHLSTEHEATEPSNAAFHVLSVAPQGFRCVENSGTTSGNGLARNPTGDPGISRLRVLQNMGVPSDLLSAPRPCTDESARSSLSSFFLCAPQRAHEP